MKLNSKRVTEEEWLRAEQLGQREQSFMHSYGTVMLGLVSGLVAFRLSHSVAVASLAFAVVSLGVFLWNVKAPDPSRYCPDRKALPNRHWLLGNAPEVLENLPRFGDFLVEQFEKLGNGWVAVAPNHTVSYFYRDPATVKHVTKTNFKNYPKSATLQRIAGDLFGHGIFVVDGQLWKSQRKTASTMFTMRFLRDFMTEIFAKHAQRLCDKLAKVKEEEEVDLADLFFRLTLDAFVEIAFGVELGCIASYPTPVKFATAFDSVQKGIAERFWNPTWKLDQLFGRGTEGPLKEQIEIMNDFALRIIRDRRVVNEDELHKRPDLLSRFIANARKNNDTPRMLSDEYLRDLVLNFVIAGRDTTAQTLSWLFYELNQHGDNIERIREETGAVTNSEGLDYEALNHIPFTHAVVSETLRLHPPVPMQFKAALNDDVLPDGTNVNAGDIVRLCNYAMARNKEVWGEDATEFKPTRFLDDAGKFVNFEQFQFFSFNAGPRTCLGKPAAYLEAKLAAAMLLRRFDFQVVPEQNLTYGVSLTLPVKGDRGGMFVKVKSRPAVA